MAWLSFFGFLLIEISSRKAEPEVTSTFPGPSRDVKKNLIFVNAFSQFSTHTTPHHLRHSNPVPQHYSNRANCRTRANPGAKRQTPIEKESRSSRRIEAFTIFSGQHQLASTHGVPKVHWQRMLHPPIPLVVAKGLRWHEGPLAGQ